VSGADRPAFLPPDFGNDWLQNMAEIVVPRAIDWLPQTWGWLVLLVLALLILGRWRRRRRAAWEALAYQREARSEFETLRRQIAAGDIAPDNLRRVPGLLKQVALKEHPREQVAGLWGDAWLEWLDDSLPGGGFRDGPGRLLPQLAYADDRQLAQLDRELLRQLVALCVEWLERPRAQLPRSDDD
jgi:hypothetical protein